MTDHKWCVIPSGKNRDEKPKMKDLYSNVVEQYAKDWKRLGLELGLEDYEVDIISANNEYHSNKVVVCSIAILERWLRVASSPTWGKLDDAIKKIKKSKTGPMLTDSSASTGSQVANCSSSTKINVPSKASFEFAKLVEKIISELEKNEKYNLDYIIKICGHLSVEDDPAVLLFNGSQLEAIKYCNDLRALFVELRHFWRWDNLSLLEEIVQSVGSEFCKLFLSEYRQNLDYKMELRKIYDHFQKEKCLPDGYTSVFAEPGRAYCEIALDGYSELMQFTSQCCGVKQMFMLPFARPLSDSSVLFEWFIPLKIISYMIKKATDNISTFTQKGFVFLKIDSTEIFDLRIKSVHENKNLSDAIKCGNAAKVKCLLQSVDPKKIDEWTALHAAAENGQVRVVETLIELGANVNTISIDDWTPLLGAVRNNHVAVIETLVRSGADVNGGNLDKWTPIFCAARRGNAEAVESLIKLGANIWAGNISKWTPLHTAARNGHATVVEILLKGGADADAGDRNNWTPLHAAARQGHARVVGVLIELGANINVGDVNKWTPLHGAAEQGHIHVAELLISSGANVNAVTNDGRSSLHFAAEHNHVEVVNYLIKSKANVHAVTKHNSIPLHLAVQNFHNLVAELVIGSGANINATDKDEVSSLHFAAKSSNIKIMKLLIKSGANVNARDKNLYSPLHFAVENGNIEMVKMLFRAGDVNAVNKISSHEGSELNKVVTLKKISPYRTKKEEKQDVKKYKNLKRPVEHEVKKDTMKRYVKFKKRRRTSQHVSKHKKLIIKNLKLRNRLSAKLTAYDVS